MSAANEPRHHQRGQLPDYYGMLGVPENASLQEVEAAYWRQARADDSGEGLPLLNEAYEILGSGGQRRAYDAQRRTDGAAEKEPRVALTAEDRGGLGNAVRFRGAPLIMAAIASTVAFALAVLAGSMLAALFAAIPPVVILGSLAKEARRRSPSPEGLVRKAARQADAGRKLAIYERETGLLAHWYIALRCKEECYQADRYQRPLTLLLVEPTRESDAWVVQGQLADWLRRNLRTSDIAGYLGNGRYVVLMPETDLSQAARLALRLCGEVEHAEAGLSSCPEGGDNLKQLSAAASCRLGRAFKPAALAEVTA